MILLPSRYCDFNHTAPGWTHASNQPLWTAWKQTDHSPTLSQPLRVYFAPPLPFPYLSPTPLIVLSSDTGPRFGAQLLDAFITLTDKRDSNLFIAARHLYPTPWWSLRKLLSPKTVRKSFSYLSETFSNKPIFLQSPPCSRGVTWNLGSSAQCRGALPFMPLGSAYSPSDLRRLATMKELTKTSTAITATAPTTVATGKLIWSSPP
mgnify:CR=1 FL=1